MFLHGWLQYWPRTPFQLGFPQPGRKHGISTLETTPLAATMPRLQALLQYSPGLPFQLGIPHFGLMQTAVPCGFAATLPHLWLQKVLG